MAGRESLQLLITDLRKAAIASAQTRYAREATFFSLDYLTALQQFQAVEKRRIGRELEASLNLLDSVAARKTNFLAEDAGAKLRALDAELAFRQATALPVLV